MEIADCLQPEDGNGATADFPPADAPPALVRKPRSDITRSNIDNNENPGKGEHEEWINQKLHSPWICTDHQHGWENSDGQRCDIMDIANGILLQRIVSSQKKAIVCHTRYVMIV